MKNLRGNDGTSLTGIWIKVDSQKQSGLSMIELLNSNRAILTQI